MPAPTASKTAKNPKPARQSLGRGLSALIPESDFDLLGQVARGEAPPAPLAPGTPASAPEEKKQRDVVTLPTSQKDSGSPKDSHSESGETPTGEVRYLEIHRIEPNPYQPRQIFSEAELEDLAASIREHGVLQPILVRPLAHGPEDVFHFQLIAGERRWRAAQKAGLSQIPAIVRDVDDKSALELAIIENVQRHDISAVESAQAYKRLAREFSLSQEQIANRVGKSRAAIANTMRLLDLPTECLDALRENKISEGHGRALLTAQGEGARRALLRRVLRDQLSVREVEKLAREGIYEENQSDNLKLETVRNADLVRLENQLARALGVRLKIKARGRGGQLSLDYASPEELQRLAKRLMALAESP